jgi:hypothetical protein
MPKRFLRVPRLIATIVQIALGDDSKGANGCEHSAFSPVDLVDAVAFLD